MFAILSTVWSFISGKGLLPYILIVVALLGVGLYVNHLQSQVKLLQQEQVLDKVNIQEKDQELANVKKDIVQIESINKDLMALQEQNDSQASVLANKLNRLHDFPTAKVQLLQDLVNKASDDRNECLRIASGGNPVKKEQNKQCPQLMPVKK